MGNTDSIPVVSQLKSLTESIAGDNAAALQTQKNFAYNNTFPVVSQIASAGMAIAGDPDGATKDLQVKFAKDMERVIASIPVAGHIEGGVYYAIGDKVKGEEAMKSASRSTGVLAGGVAGFVAGGPVGAAAGGVAGGAAADLIITKSDELAKGKDKAKEYGYITVAKEIGKAIKGGSKITVDQGFDMAMLPISDAVGGYVAGEAIAKPLAGITSGVEKTAAAAVEGPKIQVEVKPKAAIDKAALDNRANQLNPNHPKSGPGRPAGYPGAKTRADLDNHANQLNPNNPRYIDSKNNAGAKTAIGGIAVNPAAAQEGLQKSPVNEDKLKKATEAGNTAKALKTAGQGAVATTGVIANIVGSFWTATIALITLAIAVISSIYGIASCLCQSRLRRSRNGYIPLGQGTHSHSHSRAINADEESNIPIARLASPTPTPESRNGYTPIGEDQVMI